MTYISFSPKDPSEVLIVSFDFTHRLSVGETVTSCVFSVEVLEGVDAAAASILSGSVDISAAPIVKQKVIGGVLGVTYLLKALATTSTTRKVMGARSVMIVNGGAP